MRQLWNLVVTAGSRPRALERIVSEAVQAIQADGFAIALPHGKDIICECSAGLAPGAGTLVRKQGYSGQCLSSATPVYCNRIGGSEGGAVPSALLVPIIVAGEAVGLLAAFSISRPAFLAGNEAWMRAAADVLVSTGFVAPPAAVGRRPFAVPSRDRQASSTRDVFEAFGFKIQEWVLTRQKQSRLSATVSGLAAMVGLALLIAPLRIVLPFLFWLLCAPAALVAIAAGHYARLSAQRVQQQAPRHHLLGLVLGYGVAISFAVIVVLVRG